MVQRKPIKVSKKEQSFHHMNDVLMQIAKMYTRQHNLMQDFGVATKLCREEIHTVQAIGNHEGINMTELATLLEVRKPTISARVKKLIQNKLVKKRLKDGSNKEIMLTLTDQGWRAYQNHEAQHKKIYQLFQTYFGHQADDFLTSFSQELELFLQFLQDLRHKEALFQ